MEFASLIYEILQTARKQIIQNSTLKIQHFIQFKALHSIVFIFILVGTSCTSTSYAQYTVKNKKAIASYVEGVKYSRMHNYESAIQSFKNALEREEEFIEVHINLGDVYLDKKDYKKSANSYERAIQIDPNFRPTIYMQLASVQIKMAEYDKALTNLKALQEMKKVPPRIQSRFNLMKEVALFAIDAKKNPVPFDPENMGPAINSKQEEYHPSITVDGEMFVFTSKILMGTTKAGQPVFKEDLFYSKIDETKRWRGAKNFGGPINTPRNNEGASSISHDGKYLFFTACNLQGGFGSCDLYVTQQVGGKWQTPTNMGPTVNTGAWESHPSLSPNGRTLYFASSRKGGFGGTDIWQSEKLADGSWGTPQSLDFNTEGSDFTPHIHADGQTMYFSSNGREGMGGYDIYYVRKQANGGWGEVKNIGYPINSELDEFGMIADPSGRMAYYASEKEGGLGMLDIYQFDLYKDAQPITSSYIKGRVIDADTKKPLNASVELIDVQNEQLITSTNSDEINGEFLTSLPANKDYALNVSKSGYLFYSDKFELKQQTSTSPKELIIELIPVKKGASIVLKNVFFETGSFELKSTSKVELNKLVGFINANKAVSIEIGGHTDNVGNSEANQELSQNRANAVRNYLIEKGVSESRITAVGYGDTEPIADNGTEEGRAQNRRTEFVVR